MRRHAAIEAGQQGLVRVLLRCCVGSDQGLKYPEIDE